MTQETDQRLLRNTLLYEEKSRLLQMKPRQSYMSKVLYIFPRSPIILRCKRVKPGRKYPAMLTEMRVEWARSAILMACPIHTRLRVYSGRCPVVHKTLVSCMMIILILALALSSLVNYTNCNFYSHRVYHRMLPLESALFQERSHQTGLYI